MDDPASLFLLFASEGEVPENAPTILVSVIKILIVFLLVFANGFFVAAEFAFVAVRKSRIESLAEEGSLQAKRLLKVLSNLSAYLSACQLGITLTSLGIGALGEPTVAGILSRVLGDSLPPAWFHLLSFTIAFSIATSLHIVLGEQAPKLVGLQLAERVAIATALPVRIFYKSFKPFIHALDWMSAKVVSVFGIEASSEHASIYTEDEIRNLIRLSQESGHLNEEEQRLINQVFEFSETTVKEAMIPRTEIIAVPETISATDMFKAFGESGYSRMPVYRGSLDDIAGVVHSKDLVRFAGRPKSFKLEDVIHKPNYVVDTARLEDVLRQMQKEKFHFGFVVDEHGGVEGIITLEDLLEEIVGEISDEHDVEVNEQISEQMDGTYMLDGGLAVRDLNKRLELHLPISEAYTTVAGFLMSAAGQVLSEGETVPFNGHVFRIEKVEKHRIKQVRMEMAENRNGDDPGPDDPA